MRRTTLSIVLVAGLIAGFTVTAQAEPYLYDFSTAATGAAGSLDSSDGWVFTGSGEDLGLVDDGTWLGTTPVGMSGNFGTHENDGPYYREDAALNLEGANIVEFSYVYYDGSGDARGSMSTSFFYHSTLGIWCDEGGSSAYEAGDKLIRFGAQWNGSGWEIYVNGARTVFAGVGDTVRDAGAGNQESYLLRLVIDFDTGLADMFVTSLEDSGVEEQVANDHLVIPDAPLRDASLWDNGIWYRIESYSAVDNIRLIGRTLANAGLIGYWDFDGDGMDASTYGNDVIATAGVTYSANVPAQLGSGQSVVFDKANGEFMARHIDMGTGGIVGSAWDNGAGDLTISLWMKHKTGAPNVGPECVFQAQKGIWPNDDLFHFELADTYFWWTVRDTTGSQSSHRVARTWDTAWHHYALVRHGDAISAYIDGVDQAGNVTVVSEGVGMDVNVAGGGFLSLGALSDVGAGKAGFDRWFDGQIDDLAVYNQALTPEQIVSLASGVSPVAIDAGVLIPEPGPIALLAAGLLVVGFSLVRRRRALAQ
ncbi:LamG domain-containing protein [Planctomycetota bacterium]